MQRSLSACQVPLQQEYRGGYSERRRHQWHINLCSKHYCNWPGNNNRMPWKEGDIHYFFSRQPKLSTQAWWRRFWGETETRGRRRWNKGRIERPKEWNLLGRIYCRQVVWQIDIVGILARCTHQKQSFFCSSWTSKFYSVVSTVWREISYLLGYKSERKDKIDIEVEIETRQQGTRQDRISLLTKRDGSDHGKRKDEVLLDFSFLSSFACKVS